MSLINQNNTVAKSRSIGKRILQKRNGNSLFFNNPDFILNSAMNGTVTGTITITLTGDNQNVISTWSLGDNVNLFKTNTSASAITKDVGTGIDNNGTVTSSQTFNSNFYIDDINLVTGIAVSSSTSSIYSCTGLALYSFFPNLKQVSISNSRVTGFATLFSQNLDKLTFDIHTGESAYTLLKSVLPTSTLKWFTLNGYNTYITNLSEYLPASLKYLNIQNSPNLDTDLGLYFNGTRTGISSPLNGYFRYNGGARFPAVISEDSNMPIDYIVNQSSTMSRKLTSNEAGQFLVDFANQVNSVTLASKKIKFAGTAEPTSYAGYEAAKDKIRGLGIMLSFS